MTILAHLSALRARAPERRMGGARPVVSVDPDALRITVDTGDHVLTIPCEDDTEPSCSCGETIDACSGAARALDAALAAAAEPGAEMAALIEAHAAPAWRRALARFDRASGSHDAPAGRLAWAIARANRVTLTPLLERPGKKGAWLTGRPTKLDALLGGPAAAGLELLPADRAALELARTELELRRLPGRGLAAATVHRMIAALAGHPRVRLDDQPAAVSTHELSVAAIVDPDGTTHLELRLDGELALAPAELGRLEAEAEGGFAIQLEEARVRAIRLPPELAPVLELAGSRAARFPVEARLELLRRLPAIQERVAVTLHPALELRRVDPNPLPFVRLEVRAGEAAIRVRVLVRPAPEAGSFVPGEGPTELFSVDPRTDRPTSIRRRHEDERAAARSFVDSIPELAAARAPAPFTYELEGDRALLVIRALETRKEQIAVEWPERRPRIAGTVGAGHLSVRITDRQDWFGVEGGARLDARVLRLAEMLEAAARDRRFVAVGDDDWVELDRSLSAQLGLIAAIAEEHDGELLLGPVAPYVLGDLRAHDTTARWLAALERMRRGEVIDLDPPPSFTGALRAYQLEGYRWLARLAEWGLGACLADDMGLGKTVQAIALLLRRAELGPALVCAPTSVGFNWVRELERFAPALRPVLLREVRPDERPALLERAGAGDVVIIGYGLLARELPILRKLELATLVLDEAQAIKNAATDRARAAASLRASFRVALTGTPVENHLGDLWSLFHVLCPGLLGTANAFRRRYLTPDRDEARTAARRATLARAVRPFVLRRTKREVLAELPEKTEVRVDVVLTAEERARYEQARRAALAHIAGVAGDHPEAQHRFSILTALTRLRQLACDPRLVDSERDVPSSKIIAAAALLAELHDEGHHALVFSQFTGLLQLVTRALDEAAIPYLYLDGAVPPAERARRVDAFQAGQATAFLLSLKAGGSGLNLTAADYVLHLDPWWNPAAEDQATDRAHRIGQTRAVNVYRFVAKGTIEEAILSLHAEKRRLFTDIVAGAESPAALGADELLSLLRESAVAEDEDELYVPPPARPDAPPAPRRPARAD